MRRLSLGSAPSRPCPLSAGAGAPSPERPRLRAVWVSPPRVRVSLTDVAILMPGVALGIFSLPERGCPLTPPICLRPLPQRSLSQDWGMGAMPCWFVSLCVGCRCPGTPPSGTRGPEDTHLTPTALVPCRNPWLSRSGLSLWPCYGVGTPTCHDPEVPRAR